MRLPATQPHRVPAPVPPHCQGVWARTWLETPAGSDRTTWVRWLQTDHWHADLRVPAGLDRSTPEGLAQQQGFCGLTWVDRVPVPNAAPTAAAFTERCTWQRLSDYQPPGATPDVGDLVFESPTRLVETGVHAPYREVWERLPGSEGLRVTLAALDQHGQPTAERLLVAGHWLMHVRPRLQRWPAGVTPGDSLAQVLHRHPGSAAAWLDFTIAFGPWVGGEWTVERSTRPELEGQALPCTLVRTSDVHAEVQAPGLPRHWQVLGWQGDGQPAPP